jgi:hypothetical protein
LKQIRCRPVLADAGRQDERIQDNVMEEGVIETRGYSDMR